MSFYLWSQTANANATADATAPFPEGQFPGSLNDGIRGAMAALAKYRDDNGPNILTAGTSTAYTLATNQLFDTLAHLANKEFSFFCHTANGANPTLNVDGIGSYPICTDASATPVPIGGMATNGCYKAVFSITASIFILKDFYVKPWETPIGGTIIYFGSTAPNSSWMVPAGQAISRTTYATLFGLVSTRYGAGDGSTTFNLPDLSGRVPAGLEASASRLTSAVSGIDGSVLGASGGLQSHTLSTAQLPITTPAGTISSITPAGTISSITPAGTISQITPAGSVSVTSSDTSIVNASGGFLTGITAASGTGSATVTSGTSASARTSTGTLAGTPVTPIFTGSAAVPAFTGTPSAPPTFTGTAFGSGQAHNNVQPTLICNFLIRVL